MISIISEIDLKAYITYEIYSNRAEKRNGINKQGNTKSYFLFYGGHEETRTPTR